MNKDSILSRFVPSQMTKGPSLPYFSALDIKCVIDNFLKSISHLNQRKIYLKSLPISWKTNVLLSYVFKMRFVDVVQAHVST
jgi:hypothetical protein